MKHVEKIIDLLNTKEEENKTLAFKIKTKNIQPQSIIGWLSILIITGEAHLESSPITDLIEEEYKKVFDEPISWTPRDVLNKAMHGRHPSTFSLEWAFKMYQEHINALYNASYHLIESYEKSLE
jgi:hypothetical protein